MLFDGTEHTFLQIILYRDPKECKREREREALCVDKKNLSLFNSPAKEEKMKEKKNVQHTSENFQYYSFFLKEKVSKNKEKQRLGIIETK